MNIPIDEWMRTHPIGLEKLWKGAAGDQLEFVRDVIARSLMGKELTLDDFQRRNVCTIISEHRSKSIKLPVYMINRPDWGLCLVLRNNFYNWKLSVISKQPIMSFFDDLFYCHPPRDEDYTGDCLHPVYFEGFPEDLIFSYYGPSDKKTWSAEIRDNHRLYMTIVLILRALGHTQCLRQTTEEEHLTALETNV